MSHSRRWLNRAVLAAVNVLLAASMVITGTIGPAPQRGVYSASMAAPPSDALLYSVKSLNVRILDARNSVVLESNGDLPTAGSVINGIRGGATAIDQVTIEGTAVASIALAKTDVDVVTGSSVNFQMPLWGIQGTLSETSPGIYTTNLTDRLVVTPDLSGLNQADVRGWQIHPVDFSFNARRIGATSVADSVTGLGITDTVNNTVEVPFAILLKAKLVDQQGNPVANRSLRARVEAPNHAYSESVSLVTDATGTFSYQRQEKVLVTAAGGSVTRLPSPIQLAQADVSVLAFWWEDGGSWWPFDWLSQRFGRGSDGDSGAGDPINVTTGNMYLSAQDLLVPSRGLALQFARFYNSQDDYNGPLGYGWTHSYNSSLTENSDGSVTQLDPQGARVVFTRNDDGSYTAPTGNRDVLTRLPSGGFNLHKKNGVDWLYGADDRLQKITDLNANSLAFTYASGRLTQITDTVGRNTTLTYDGNGRITRVADASGRNVNYAYDANGNLTSAVDVSGLGTTYAYDGSHNLTTITEPAGGHVYFAYDTQDRATSSYRDGNVQKTDLTYDKDNRKTLVTDSRGNQSTYYYNGDGHITRIVDPLGQILQNTWDSDGNKVGISDQLRHTTRLSYDANGNLTGIVDPSGATTRLTYAAGINRLTSVVDPSGAYTRYEYDAAGNLTRAIDTLGTGTTFTYDGNGQMVASIDAAGRSTALAYTGAGNLASRIDALGNQTRFTYDALGHLSQIIDPLNRTTSFAYDGAGRVTTTTYPDGTSAVTTYDAAGRPTRSVDENGHPTTRSYDASGRLLSIANPTGATTRYTYDTEGALTSVTDALNNVTRFSYDQVNHLVQVQRPGGSLVTYGYDAVGNRTQITDANGHTTQVRYDALNRPYQFVDALGNGASLLYNSGGQVTQATNPNGHAVVYNYDAQNRVTKKIDPLGNATTFEYDANGNVVRRVDGRGIESRYSYDAQNRLVQIAYSSGGGVQFQWDAAGRLVQVSDAVGTSNYTYDARDRIVGEALPGGRNLRYTYDNVGNRLSLTDPQNGVTRYQYDAGDRLTALTDRATQTTNYTYDALSRPTQINYPNGGGVAYAYDQLSRVSSVTNTGAHAQVLAQRNYKYDGAGNPLSITDENGAASTYAYDPLNRLIRESYQDGKTQRNLSYSYDAAGNRTSLVDGANVTGYTYDAAERLIQSGTTSYSYDNNGNQVARTTSSATTRFDYDAENHMVQGGAVRYSYDAGGRLATSSDANDTITYTYDGEQVLEESNSRGPVAHYTRGPDRQLISRFSLAQGNTESYFHPDAMGNTLALSSASGGLQARWVYGAFGNVIDESRRTWLNPFTYAGNTWDERVGLYNFHARWYDPSTGRFQSQDPVPGFGVLPQTLNPYAYGVNNPLVAVDANGRIAPIIIAALIGLAVGAVIGGGAYYLTHDKNDFDWGEFALWTGAGALAGAGLAAGGWWLLGPEAAAVGEQGVAQVVLNGIRGRAFEQAALAARGWASNTQVVTATLRNGIARAIPDVIGTGVTEIKDVAYLTFTRQLQVEAEYAASQGLPFNVVVNSATRISQPVIDAVARTGGIIERFDPITGIFTKIFP